MALWAFIPEKEIVKLSRTLPLTARRLDTGQVVSDVAKWARACGYWDLESSTFEAEIGAARTFEEGELEALVAEAEAAETGADDLRTEFGILSADLQGHRIGFEQNWSGIQLPEHETATPNELWLFGLAKHTQAATVTLINLSLLLMDALAENGLIDYLDPNLSEEVTP